MTGYTMVVAADEVIQIDVSVEDAMKYVISGGVLTPSVEMVRPTSGAQYALAGGINQQIRSKQTALMNKSQILKKIDDDELPDSNAAEKPSGGPPKE
jgi:uncharacterized membrane protein